MKKTAKKRKATDELGGRNTICLGWKMSESAAKYFERYHLAGNESSTFLSPDVASHSLRK